MGRKPKAVDANAPTPRAKKPQKFNTPVKDKLLGACEVAHDKLPYKEIYSRLGVPERTARRWRQLEKNPRPRKKTGRHKAVTPEDLQNMVDYIYSGPDQQKATWEDLRSRFLPHVKTFQTIRTSMNEAGYHKCTECKLICSKDDGGMRCGCLANGNQANSNPANGNRANSNQQSHAHANSNHQSHAQANSIQHSDVQINSNQQSHAQASGIEQSYSHAQAQAQAYAQAHAHAHAQGSPHVHPQIHAQIQAPAQAQMQVIDPSLSGAV